MTYAMLASTRNVHTQTHVGGDVAEAGKSILPTVALVGVLAVGAYVLVAGMGPSMQDDWNKQHGKRRK